MAMMRTDAAPVIGNVLIVDPNEMVRERIRQIIGENFAIQTDEASTVSQVLLKFSSKKFRIVIAGLSVPSSSEMIELSNLLIRLKTQSTLILHSLQPYRWDPQLYERAIISDEPQHSALIDAIDFLQLCDRQQPEFSLIRK